MKPVARARLIFAISILPGCATWMGAAIGAATSSYAPTGTVRDGEMVRISTTHQEITGEVLAVGQDTITVSTAAHQRLELKQTEIRKLEHRSASGLLVGLGVGFLIDAILMAAIGMTRSARSSEATRFVTPDGVRVRTETIRGGR